MPLGTTGAPSVSVSMAGSFVEASATWGYGLSERHVVAPIDSLSVSVQVPVFDTPPEMLARRPDKPLSELLEFPRVSSRWIERVPTPGWPLTKPVTAGIHTAMMMTTITTHPSTASATGVAVVATGVHASAGVPLLAMSTCTAYAGPAYSLYAGHAPLSGLALACPVHKAVGQLSSTRFDPVGSTVRCGLVEIVSAPMSETT